MMAPLVWRLGAAAVIGLFALTLAARARGQPETVPDLLDHLMEGCAGRSQPCWLGIAPGVTNRVEAEAMLHERGYRTQAEDDLTFTRERDVTGCRSVRLRLYEETVTQMEVFCAGLLLGHTLLALGLPEGLQICFARYDPTFNYQGNVDVRAVEPADRLSLYLPVTLMLSARVDRFTSPWRGMMPVWRYRRLILARSPYGCG